MRSAGIPRRRRDAATTALKVVPMLRMPTTAARLPVSGRSVARSAKSRGVRSSNTRTPPAATIAAAQARGAEADRTMLVAAAETCPTAAQPTHRLAGRHGKPPRNPGSALRHRRRRGAGLPATAIALRAVMTSLNRRLFASGHLSTEAKEECQPLVERNHLLPRKLAAHTPDPPFVE